MLWIVILFSFHKAGANEFDPSYSSWKMFLDRYLENGLVDYAAVKKDPQLLNTSIANLASIDEEAYRQWNREQKIAMWINAYNIGAIKVVTDHYPVDRGLSWKALAYPSDSIQQIDNVWERGVLKIMGREHSLDGIEKGILLKQFKEARVHFAVVCASIGCPVLREEPYRADNLGEQLEDQTRRFLSDPQKVRYDSGENMLFLSPIFKWYAEDFRQAAGSVPRFVKQHSPIGEMKNLQEEQIDIDYLDYDWSLNDQS